MDYLQPTILHKRESSEKKIGNNLYNLKEVVVMLNKEKIVLLFHSFLWNVS